MSGAFSRYFFSRHPVVTLFWIPPFASVFLLGFGLFPFSPRIRDAAHTIPFSSCQKSTGICITYYITPFEHCLYISILILALFSFLIFWVTGFIESIRWISAKRRGEH